MPVGSQAIAQGQSDLPTIVSSCPDYHSVKKSIDSPSVRRLVEVSNSAELDDAINDAKPGDLIELADGQYDAGTVAIIGLHGTSQYPIRIQSRNLAGAQVRDGLLYTPQVIYLADSSHIELTGMEIYGGDPVDLSSMAVAGIIAGYDGSSIQKPAGDVNHLVISHNTIHSMRQSGIHVGRPGGASSDINISCNEIYDTGLETPLYGEGIYVGNGKDNNSADHDIRIDANHIHLTGGEAIDIKAPVYNVSITRNWIHDIESVWTGAVALGVDLVDYRSANYVFDGNLIYNITSSEERPSNGNGVVAGHGTTRITNNIIWNVEDRAIAFFKRGGGTGMGFADAAKSRVYVFNNTFYRCGDECIGENSYLPGDGQIEPRLSMFNNLLHSQHVDQHLGSYSYNLLVESSDFIGPLQGNADAGDGPGSGFYLDSTSGAIDAGLALGPMFGWDISGQFRSDRYWDYGAYEYQHNSGTTRFRMLRRQTD